MSTSLDTGIVPEFTKGDRLRKARLSAGLSVEDFAHRALISPKTVNNYEGDRVGQRPLVMEKWAAVTGVSLRWLETGATPPAPPPNGTDTRPDRSSAVADLAARKRGHGGPTTTDGYLDLGVAS